jgi:hypothetical protein
MSVDDIKSLLDTLQKPLAAASRNEFALLKSLAGMESFVKARVRELLDRTRGDRRVSALEELFEGFDTLPLDRKRSGSVRRLQP